MVGKGLTLAVAVVLVKHLGEDCYLESFCREGIGVVWRRSEGLVKRLCAAESVMMCMLMQHVS